MKDLNTLTSAIIGCGIEVHRRLGPGLLEAIYEAAMCVELEFMGLSYRRQVEVPVIYRDRKIARYRIDLIVTDLVVVEIKSVEALNPLHEAQILSYLRLTRAKIGLLMNFNARMLKQGVRRFIL